MELKEREESSMVATSATAEAEERVATRPIPIKGQRRNLGRQARKRRKKYLEIEAAASLFVTAAISTAASAETDGNATEKASAGNHEVLASNPSARTSSTAVLPTDRGYVLDDVRRRASLSEADRHDLIRQLGYLPGNALRVVARVEDAFSSDDLQRLFAATAAVVGATSTPKKTETTRGESASARDSPSSNSNLSNVGDNPSAASTNGTTANCDDEQTHEKRAKMMASMIQAMMKEPLVIKLYPLVLRDESSSTKRRRKRRREEIEDDSTALQSKATNAATSGENSCTETTGIEEHATTSPASTAAKPQSTPLMEPFPTIYWVTHPLIKALISKLELDRVNVQFEQRLLDEEAEGRKPEEICPTDKNNQSAGITSHPPSPLASMKLAHESYGKERRGLLSSRDMEYVKGRRWYEETSSPPDAKISTAPFSDGCGVAGIRNPKAVKCLHAHAAHYWSGNRDNIVGLWVGERLKSGNSFFQGSIKDQKKN